MGRTLGRAAGTAVGLLAIGGKVGIVVGIDDKYETGTNVGGAAVFNGACVGEIDAGVFATAKVGVSVGFTT